MIEHTIHLNDEDCWAEHKDEYELSYYGEIVAEFYLERIYAENRWLLIESERATTRTWPQILSFSSQEELIEYIYQTGNWMLTPATIVSPERKRFLLTWAPVLQER